MKKGRQRRPFFYRYINSTSSHHAITFHRVQFCGLVKFRDYLAALGAVRRPVVLPAEDLGFEPAVLALEPADEPLFDAPDFEVLFAELLGREALFADADFAPPFDGDVDDFAEPGRDAFAVLGFDDLAVVDLDAVFLVPLDPVVPPPARGCVEGAIADSITALAAPATAPSAAPARISPATSEALSTKDPSAFVLLLFAVEGFFDEAIPLVLVFPAVRFVAMFLSYRTRVAVITSRDPNAADLRA